MSRRCEPSAGLVAIARSARILSRSAIEIDGRPRPIPAGPPEGPQGSREQVAGLLYGHFHCRLPAAPQAAGTDGRRGSEVFVARLSAANRGTCSWEAGWIIREIDPSGPVVVEKHGVRFWTDPSRVRGDGGGAPAPGAARVRVGKEQRQLVPGFYLAIGDADEPGPAVRPDPIVRLYWHLARAGAGVAFVELLTSLLNREGLPFRLKVPNAPALYPRADAGVLYLPRGAVQRARPVVVAVHRALRGALRAPVPLLARRLAAGLSLAEDPGTGESFGQHRCRLVAEGLWAAFEAGSSSFAARLEAVAASVRGAGLDPARPHLSPGAGDADFPG